MDLQYVEGPMKADERREALRALNLILENSRAREYHAQAAGYALKIIGRQINPPVLAHIKMPEASP